MRLLYFALYLCLLLCIFGSSLCALANNSTIESEDMEERGDRVYESTSDDSPSAELAGAATAVPLAAKMSNMIAVLMPYSTYESLAASGEPIAGLSMIASLPRYPLRRKFQGNKGDQMPRGMDALGCPCLPSDTVLPNRPPIPTTVMLYSSNVVRPTLPSASSGGPIFLTRPFIPLTPALSITSIPGVFPMQTSQPILDSPARPMPSLSFAPGVSSTSISTFTTSLQPLRNSLPASSGPSVSSSPFLAAGNSSRLLLVPDRGSSRAVKQELNPHDANRLLRPSASSMFAPLSLSPVTNQPSSLGQPPPATNTGASSPVSVFGNSTLAPLVKPGASSLSTGALTAGSALGSSNATMINNGLKIKAVIPDSSRRHILSSPRPQCNSTLTNGHHKRSGHHHHRRRHDGHQHQHQHQHHHRHHPKTPQIPVPSPSLSVR